MFNFYATVTAAAPWLVWLIDAGVIVSALTAIIRFGPPAWRTASRFVATINALAELPEALIEQADFRLRTTATLAAQDVKIEEIHHEVNYNNGSSVKDAIERIENIIDADKPPRPAPRKRTPKPSTPHTDPE